jgi:2-dehydro-3-deoxygalactonokinase
MGAAAFIAGDWGTTNLRLFLCDERGVALDSVDGPGVAALAAASSSAVGSARAGTRLDCSGIFASLVQTWTSRYGGLPAVLCGMAGSDIGWMPVPYVDCPALPQKLLDGCVALDGADVHIVPGLRCRNRLGAPDLMRGEETQILGAIRLDPGLAEGRNLVCLPGTHTKWALLQDGSVAEFITAPTGELFALLRDHSILVRSSAAGGDAADERAFDRGLRRLREHPQVQLLHLLFECRSRRITGEAGMEDPAAFLSGLLIASDVRGALALFAPGRRTVALIGAPALTRAYAAALEVESVPTRSVEGSAAALAGLAAVRSHLAQRPGPHAA